MTIDFSHPTGLLEQKEYWPVAAATGSRTVLLAGQVGVSASGAVEATDLAGQIHSALRNVAIGVRAAGGDVQDIARLTFYVVGWTADMAEMLFDGVARAQAGEGYPSPMPPLTLIGVQALWSPELLVEIEAVAVLD